MKNMLRDVVGTLEHSELMRMRKDIENGGIQIRKLIEAQIRENERQHELFCTVCSSDIDPRSHTSFTLMFGPDGFKKKATFCAEDCLKYFLTNLENMRAGAYKQKH
jgi:hypothetical protein